jgi:hypothetical protein
MHDDDGARPESVGAVEILLVAVTTAVAIAFVVALASAWVS